MVEVFDITYLLCLVIYINLFSIFHSKLKIDPRYLDVENLHLYEFTMFEDKENPTLTSSNIHPSSDSDHVGKKPRVSQHTSLDLNHFTSVNK